MSNSSIASNHTTDLLAEELGQLRSQLTRVYQAMGSKRALQESTNAHLDRKARGAKRMRSDSPSAPSPSSSNTNKTKSFWSFFTWGQKRDGRVVVKISQPSQKADFMPDRDPIPGPSKPSTKPHEAPLPPSEQLEAQLKYLEEKVEWKWKSADARAAGREPPPPPIKPQFKKRTAMGAHKHLEKVRDRDAKMVEDLKALNLSPQLQGRTAAQSLAEYRQMVHPELSDFESGVFGDAGAYLVGLKTYNGLRSQSIATSTVSPQIPSNKLALSRSTSLGKPPRSKYSSVDAAIHRAKVTERAPPPMPETLRLDGLREQIEKIDQEDKPKVRRRKFPSALSAENEAKVAAAHNDRYFRAELPSADVNQTSLNRLKGLSWLNDEVIQFWASLVNERSKNVQAGKVPEGFMKDDFKKAYSFNSFWYKKYEEDGAGYAGVKRWTKKIDLFSYDIILFPINWAKNHWVCAAINMKDRRFEYYDSLGGRTKRVYDVLRRYITEEHLDKKKKPLDLTDWEDYWDSNIPQQANSSDCGVFTCQFMESLSRNNTGGFDFTQQQMPYFRKKMVLEMLKREFIAEPWLQ